jgi:hypothetical protein
MRRAVRRALAEKPPTLLAKMENGALISVEVKRLSGLVSDGRAEELVAEALRNAGFSVEFTAGEEAANPRNRTCPD